MDQCVRVALLQSHEILWVARRDMGLIELRQEQDNLLCCLNTSLFEKITEIVGLGGNSTYSFLIETFQGLLKRQMTHENRVNVARTPQHVLCSVNIIIRLDRPFLRRPHTKSRRALSTHEKAPGTFLHFHYATLFDNYTNYTAWVSKCPVIRTVGRPFRRPTDGLIILWREADVHRRKRTAVGGNTTPT